MNAEVIGKKAIKAADWVINYLLLAIIMLPLAFAVYALWDSQQIYNEADKASYTVYKPTVENEGKSFREFQEINPEIIAWLTVYGTNIDYPITQGPDNMKYVNTNAEGKYSLSGSIFLHSKNNSDFSDFNSILYGHHMEKKRMFGEIGGFSDRSVFETHKYGNLYYEGNNYGIEFFAFIHTDAYNYDIFTVHVRDEMTKQNYLSNLLNLAANSRDTGVTIEDRIILLTTCSARTTNGRDILVGRITDNTFENTFFDIETKEKTPINVNITNDSTPVLMKWIPISALLLLVLTIVLILIMSNRRKRKNGEEYIWIN